MRALSIKPGDMIADRYRIESLLGSGGHAHVFLAHQEKLGRKVAIKVLKPQESEVGIAETQKQQVMVKRFDQEARLISQLRDPHTITMYDYGATSDGLLYMVCEYIEGESLKELLVREGKLKPERVMHIMSQLLASLQEAHALGVLHRDLKPDNIMLYTHLGKRDQVKLLDFGIAKMAGGPEEIEDLTAEGSLVGTPRYIAPERIRGEEVRPASDLYSLGLVAYEAITGKKVLAGLSGVRALQSQLGDPSLKLPHDLTLPSGLKHVIEKLIEKELDMRYKVAEQVLMDLEKIERGMILGTPNFDDEATYDYVSSAPRREATELFQARQRATVLNADPTATLSKPPSAFDAKLDPAAVPAYGAPPLLDGLPAAPAPSRGKRAPKSSKLMMVVVIGVLLVAIIAATGVLAYLVLNH